MQFFRILVIILASVTAAYGYDHQYTNLPWDTSEIHVVNFYDVTQNDIFIAFENCHNKSEGIIFGATSPFMTLQNVLHQAFDLQRHCKYLTIGVELPDHVDTTEPSQIFNRIDHCFKILREEIVGKSSPISVKLTIFTSKALTPLQQVVCDYLIEQAMRDRIFSAIEIIKNQST